MKIFLKDTPKHFNKTVTIQGWVFNHRSSGKIAFLQFRDGSGQIQAVASKNDLSIREWKECQKITLETSLELTGKLVKDDRSPFGAEMQVQKLKLIQQAKDYPISKKDHGVDFLLDHRHLWVRSGRQAAILKIRDQIIWSIRSFLKEKGFILTDSPILTPSACEGTTNLFETKYFKEKAYLSQSGQLYIEALIYSLGKVYDFGPTFRAEKSKTRRHLMEFWMIDVEAAFMDHQENMQLQEDFICYIVKQVLKNCAKELKVLNRDIKPLKAIKGKFPRISYSKAIDLLKKQGSKVKFGDDFGADEETIISKAFDQPVFIERYPGKIKAFYMKPDPKNPKLVLNNDLIAPEGYGEIIGGSQRIDQLEVLKKKIKEFKLPVKHFQWYLDLRKYGSVPHSGFGLGLERTVAWICKLDHVRETIPFPRLMNRLKP